MNVSETYFGEDTLTVSVPHELGWAMLTVPPNIVWSLGTPSLIPDEQAKLKDISPVASSPLSVQNIIDFEEKSILSIGSVICIDSSSLIKNKSVFVLSPLVAVMLYCPRFS
ncbi:MAG: hypothetical protein BWY55_00639 [archaeon ADurb.Bin336]|nr:MAG: hypothetical protein BWY55_00639 [archaeon ADurb.Bin336]